MEISFFAGAASQTLSQETRPRQDILSRWFPSQCSRSMSFPSTCMLLDGFVTQGCFSLPRQCAPRHPPNSINIPYSPTQQTLPRCEANWASRIVELACSVWAVVRYLPGASLPCGPLPNPIVEGAEALGEGGSELGTGTGLSLRSWKGLHTRRRSRRLQDLSGGYSPTSSPVKLLHVFLHSTHSWQGHRIHISAFRFLRNGLRTSR